MITKSTKVTPYRTRPLEVFSLGISRTGTASMAAAFEILGLPAYHGLRLINFPAESPYWERAADAKYYDKGQPFTREEWDRYLLGNFSAVTDIGGYMFWPELLELYPDAKVVLVERDVEKWYKSFDASVLASTYGPAADFVRRFIPGTSHASIKLYSGFFGSDGKPAGDLAEVKRNAKTVYRKHYNTIRQLVPRERLLNYELGSGWEPLCSFLGKPIPDVDFPRTNEQAEFDRRIKGAYRRLLWRAATLFAGYVLLPVAVVVVAVHLANKVN